MSAMKTDEMDAPLERLAHAIEETHRIQSDVLELFRIMLADDRKAPVPVSAGYSLPPQMVFTVQEACELLRLSENTMYEVLRRGDIESVRLGHTYRIPRHALEAFVGGS
jgi:excisionase family DNA binding protein